MEYVIVNIVARQEVENTFAEMQLANMRQEEVS